MGGCVREQDRDSEKETATDCKREGERQRERTLRLTDILRYTQNILVKSNILRGQVEDQN